MEKILTNGFETPYVICSNKKHGELLSKNQSVIVLRDVSLIKVAVSILKEDVSIYYPDFEEKYPEVIEYFSNPSTEAAYDAVVTPSDVLGIADKISIPNQVVDKLNQFTSDSNLIPKECIHKHHQSNVLISECYTEVPNVFFMRGYRRLTEIQLDHTAGDHMESMILTEIFGQACIAASEKEIGKQEYFIPIQDTKIYRRFINKNDPLLVQVLTHKSRKSEGFCVVTFWQNNKCCLKGFLVGKIYSADKRDTLVAQ
ncbi:hypothetical protein [Fructobacillus durionis]|uniref:hypothetical protein n=1 Tax=Fructobacillus durionis TaxID=283737 RepID=UPI003616C186